MPDAIGMYLAFAYYEFRRSGELVLPVIGLPERVALLDRPTVASALVVVVLLGALLFAVDHFIVGPENEMAHGASLAVGIDGSAATPSFILGSPGTYGLVCVIVMWSLTLTVTAVRMVKMDAPEIIVTALRRFLHSPA